ncbi:hypothetical protein ACFX14_018873 [Malus domestica]
MRWGRHGPTRIISNLQTPEQCRLRWILGRPAIAFFLLVFAPFFTQFSPECHKSREEEGYTSWELQIPQKLIGKILPKPATFEPRDPDVKTEPTKHSELRKNLLELAVSLDCLKT